jgi:uncharacterized caspase-like protein
LVVGISEYRDSPRIPALRYAAKDAQDFYNWLIAPQGGRYSPNDVKLLLDKDATALNIKDALYQWLPQALAEDLVTIYFAGHGTPETPDASDNLFLVPYDANYDKIASTAFPMWDIETALKRFIKARKVVVIADACHAGGIGGEFATARRGIGVTDVGKITQGLQGLTQVNDGVAVITSADNRQLSREGEQWGGGHGVFTHYLLKGLQGSADLDKDNAVTLAELIQYLSENVRKDTKNTQSPQVAGKFDPSLTLGK